MIRTAAKVFGIAFILVGILGFVPGITNDGHLLGIFHVNAAHNIIHLASGAAALAAAYSSLKASRLYFQVFGIVYGLVTILGIFSGDKDLLGIVAHNTADIFLHLAITAASLYFGFVAKDNDARTV
jgi:hypothetical protein